MTDDSRPSDAQLSALAARLGPQKDGQVHAPFVEFAIFGPYDGRFAKLRAFLAQVLVRDGTWRNKMVRGPQSFAEWEASWRVYATALVMLGVAWPWGPLTLFRRDQTAGRAVPRRLAVGSPPRRTNAFRAVDQGVPGDSR